jgi:hypothetical protein
MPSESRIFFRYKGPVAGSPSYTFSVPERFKEGDVLTAGAAQALSQLLAENVQDNMRKVFLTELAACMPGEMLETEAQTRIQASIDKYAANYEFILRHQPRAKLSTIELEARIIAKELVEAQQRQQGAELSEADRESAIEAASELEWVKNEAEARVQARAKITASAAEELL